MKKPDYDYVKANIIYWAFEFLRKRATPDKLARESHMNAFGNSIENTLLGTENTAWNPKNKGKKPKKFDAGEVERLVSAILAETNPTSNNNLEAIYSVERGVRKVLPSLYVWSDDGDLKLDRDTIDALAVEFINYIGIRIGMDYAIYTKDLREPHDRIYEKGWWSEPKDTL